MNHGYLDLVARHICARAEWLGSLLPFSSSDAKGFRGIVMIYLTAVTAAFTFGYLLMAMIRPERF